jgi:DNA topoisomerase IA
MMQYKFTKEVEADFDKIASEELKFQDMLQGFWDNTLKKDLENA